MKLQDNTDNNLSLNQGEVVGLVLSLLYLVVVVPLALVYRNMDYSNTSSSSSSHPPPYRSFTGIS